MAKIGNVANTLFDSILPTYGNAGNNLPVWNEGQKMFISSEYESTSGNRYYKGLRFCEQLAIVETVGLYHTWTYIDGVEIYAFNGNKPKLVGKRQYEKRFYNTTEIKADVEQMVQEYLHGQLKIQNVNIPAIRIEEEAKSVVERSYKSFLSEDYSTHMQNMIPLLCAENQ